MKYSRINVATSVPLVLSVLFFLSLPASAQIAGEPRTALGYLEGMIKDPKTANATVGTLQTTEDPALAPLLAAMTRSADKERRLFGVAVLPQFEGKKAANVLIERVNYDPSMPIRAEALARLIALDALTPEQLAGALKIPDDSVQSIACRALAEKGKADLALPVLTRLADSKEEVTAALCRACLVGLGKAQYLDGLRRVMRDPAAEPRVLGALLGQIRRQKVSSAASLALEVANNETAPLALRVLAHETAADVSSSGAASLNEALAKTDNLALRIRLLGALSSRDDGGPYLAKLAAGADTIGVLAKFEMARKTGGATAGASVKAAIALEHPIALAYVLDRAGQDANSLGAKADFYTPALLEFIRSVEPRPSEMQKEHFLAAGATEQLVRIGTPTAIAGLRAILAEKSSAITRSVAAGLLRARKPETAELMRPLLESPYDELVVDAALMLGHFADPAARPKLQAILAQADSHPPALVILASWYILKIDKKTDQAVAELAKLIKPLPPPPSQ
jgi:HEAT repeat protein